MNTFENLKLNQQILKVINGLGYKEPTQIQKDTIPLILEGKDVIGESATGSGKTLAFGVGIIEKCKPGQGVQAIVLVPTRELAEQVKDEIVRLAYKNPIRIMAVYGGVSINPQIDQLRKSEVVIATPGRLLDHLNRRTIDTSKVNLVVLDEADRLVDMGFIDDVERIISACPKNRQTLLFSATMHSIAEQIARRHMKDPKTIHAIKMVDPSKLKQTYYDVPSKFKREFLVQLLQKEKSDLVMVFCNTRRETEVVVDALKANSIKAAAIHGGLTQVKRLKTIELFHKGKMQVLVCTDVAARGLHIEGVTHIYNYDIPKEPGDYVHRIGRTARAGKNGLVINVLAYRDYDNYSRLISAYGDFKIEKMETPKLNGAFKSSPKRRDPGRGYRGPPRGQSGGSRGPPSRNRGPKRNFRRI